MSQTVEEQAENGSLEAQCNLAFLFEIGLDRAVDLDQALYWWRKAADQGNVLAIEKVRLLGGGIVEPPEKKSVVPNFREGRRLQTKILVVDDEPDLLAIISKSLEFHGFQVFAKSNGEEGLQTLVSNPDIKVVLSDLKMPVMNGIQFIKTIRRMQLAENSIIIVMTAFSKPQLIATGKKLRVDHWLAKPFDMEKLVEFIDKSLQKRIRVA